MATPSARLVIKFDADTSGIDQSKSKLTDLKGAIEADTAALKEMSDAMTRLRGTAEVVRWEALPKDIRAAENEIAKFSAKMAKLKEDFAKAPEGKKGGIFAAGLEAQGGLDKATRRLGALRDEQKKLAGTSPVKLFEDMKAASEKLKSSLGKNQTELSRMGGSMKDAKSKMDQFAEGASAAGSPLGGMVQKFQSLKALGPAAIYVAIGIALVAVATGFAIIIGKATAFAIAMSDAARSIGLTREAAAGSVAGAKELEAITLRIEGKTDAQREAVIGLSNEYARLRFSMQSVEGATSAITVATQVMGAAAGSTLKGLIDRGVDTKRFWLGAFDLKGTGLARGDVAKQLAKQMKIAVGAAETALRDGTVKLDDGIKALDAAVEARFGALARKQMLALPVQLDRAKKNFAALFAGVNVEGFLEKLDDALGLLKESGSVGKGLKTALTAVFQPLVNSAGSAMPLLEGFILGVTIGLQKLVILGLKLAIAFKSIWGQSNFLKDLDLVTVGLYAGIAAFTLFALTMGALALVLGTVAVTLAILSIPLLAIVAIVVGVGLAIYWVVDTIMTTLDDLATYLADSGTSIEDAAEGITDAIINAVEGGIGDVIKAFSDLGKAGVKAFKDAFGIASPAKKILAPAREIPNAIVKASDEGQPRVKSALERLGSPDDVSLPSGQSIAGRLANAAGAAVSIVFNYYGNGSRDDMEQAGEYLIDAIETQQLARAR